MITVDHDTVELHGTTICTKCGQTGAIKGTCTGGHEITAMLGKIMCIHCGRIPGEFGTPCTEKHDITGIQGKLTCRKCGRSGTMATFQKTRCNSNHNIVLVGGKATCRRCGMTKDWDKKRCGI